MILIYLFWAKMVFHTWKQPPCFIFVILFLLSKDCWNFTFCFQKTQNYNKRTNIIIIARIHFTSFVSKFEEDFLKSAPSWLSVPPIIIIIINAHALPGVRMRAHANHRDGHELGCGEENHAIQTSAVRHSNACHGTVHLIRAGHKV